MISRRKAEGFVGYAPAHFVTEQLSVRGIELDLVLASRDTRFLPGRIEESLRGFGRPRADRNDLVLDVRDLARARIDEEIECKLVGDPTGAQDAPAAGVCHIGEFSRRKVEASKWGVGLQSGRLGPRGEMRKRAAGRLDLTEKIEQASEWREREGGAYGAA